MVILCKNLSSVAQIVSEIWLFKNTEQDRKSRSQGVICNPKKQFLVFFTTFFHFYILLLLAFLKSLLNVISCKNLSSVAQIVSEIWLLQNRELVLNECRQRPKIKVFVIFQYFLQIAVVYIFWRAYYMQYCVKISAL